MIGGDEEAVERLGRFLRRWPWACDVAVTPGRERPRFRPEEQRLSPLPAPPAPATS